MKRSLRFVQFVLASSVFVSSLTFADTIVTAQYDEPVPNPQLVGSTTGSIEITASGKINATGIDGIQIDTDSITITVDPNNSTAGNNAIIASGVGNGINILNGAGVNTGTIINVGSGSNITTTGTGSGILIGDTAATVSNSGGIFGGASAIDISAGGTNAVIANNGTTALIQGGTGPSILVEGVVANGGTGLNLSNTGGGVISALNASDAIQVNQTFTSITNNTGSTITAVNGNAINIGQAVVGSMGGDVENFGIIQTTGSGSALAVIGNYTGVINNNSTGVLQNATNTPGGGVVRLNNSFGVLNNAGTIQSIGAAGFFNAILISANAPGTINNSGTILSTNQSATVFIGSNLTGINNTGTGTISGKPSGAAVNEGVLYVANNNVTVANGVVNNGTIINTLTPAVAGWNAINFQTAGANITVPLFQQGGTITGNVLLSSNSSQAIPAQYALTMSGGTITGNVTSSSNNPSTLQLNGGTIKGNGGLILGNLQLGNVAGNIVNLNGTTTQAIIGGTNSDTFNLSGGSFTSLNGNGGADIINVNGLFTQNGTIANIPTVNVLNNGRFIVNNQITGTTAFNINTGGNMTTNFANLNGSNAATITIQQNGSLTVNQGSTFTAGAANNSGTIALQPSGTLVLTNAGGNTGNYVQTATGILSPGIATAASFGQLQTTGSATFIAGSTMAPFINTGGVFLAPGTQWVAVATGGVVVGAPTLVQPPSALVFFEQQVNANNIVLTFQAHPIASVAIGDNAQSIGAALDPVLFGGTTNPELLAVLGQLELMPDSTYLTQALLQLVPSLNYALPATSRISMDTSLDSVQQRLEQLHHVGVIPSDEEYKNNRDYELYNGVNYGDRNVIYLGYNRFSAWAKVLGVIIDQHKLDEVDGFKADDVGIAIGGDWRLTDSALVGLALSWNKIETTDRTTAQNKIDTWSYQATFYGWFEPMDQVYLDTMLAVASHKYETLRNMQIGNFTANASATFLGTHYGAQADLGYVFLSPENWYVAPYARFRYTYLDVGKYTEKGAGGINLSVTHEPIDEMIGGIGLRIAAKRDYVQAIYVPEVSATLLYDFAGKAEIMQGTFLGGGGVFNVESNSPQQLIQLYSVGVNAYTNDGYCAALKFTFEHREQLFGYYGFLQISYLWD